MTESRDLDALCAEDCFIAVGSMLLQITSRVSDSLAMVYTAYLMLGKNAANENVWLCRHCNKPAVGRELASNGSHHLCFPTVTERSLVEASRDSLGH
jgi:hypothetical protein